MFSRTGRFLGRRRDLLRRRHVHCAVGHGCGSAGRGRCCNTDEWRCVLLSRVRRRVPRPRCTPTHYHDQRSRLPRCRHLFLSLSTSLLLVSIVTCSVSIRRGIGRLLQRSLHRPTQRPLQRPLSASSPEHVLTKSLPPPHSNAAAEAAPHAGGASAADHREAREEGGQWLLSIALRRGTGHVRIRVGVEGCMDCKSTDGSPTHISRP